MEKNEKQQILEWLDKLLNDKENRPEKFPITECQHKLYAFNTLIDNPVVEKTNDFVIDSAVEFMGIQPTNIELCYVVAKFVLFHLWKLRSLQEQFMDVVGEGES